MDFYKIVTEVFGLRERTRRVQLFNCKSKEFVVLDLVTSYPLKRDVTMFMERVVYRLKLEDDLNTHSMILHCSIHHAKDKFVYILIDEDKKNQYFVVSIDN